MASFFLDGPDELAKLEFMSRQKLLMEDKIMKNKINNYVQLVHALTGQEVFMPVDDDAYSFVSVSSEEEVEEEVIPEEEETIEYVEVEEVAHGVDDFLLESVRSEPGHRLELSIENLEELQDIPEAPPMVDDAPPPTPSMIIRKLKATLVESTMVQIRNKRKSVRRLEDNNWNFDLARRRLDRELKRIQNRRAYRDAVERLPALTETLQEAKEAEKSSPIEVELAEKDAKVIHDAESKRPSPLERQMSRRGSLSGSVFAGLLKTLDKRPSGNASNASKRSSGGAKTRRQYRSDQRLQAILNKHHTNLKEEKARLQSLQSELPPAEEEK